MSTNSTPVLRSFAHNWESLPDYPSAVFSGIVGDLAHKLRGGYHISIEDQPTDNYSVIRADDKAPPGSWPRDEASAVDMSMNLSDLKKCHARLVNVWKNRDSDPRAKYINAFDGWDGNGSPGRYDMVKGTIEVANDSHKTHEHIEFRRRYVNDTKATAAVLSVVKGETVAQFLGGDMLDSTDHDWIDGRLDTLLTRIWAAKTIPALPGITTDDGKMTAMDVLTRIYNRANSGLTNTTDLKAALASFVDEVETAVADIKAAVSGLANMEGQNSTTTLAILGEIKGAVENSGANITLTEEQMQALTTAVSGTINTVLGNATTKLDTLSEALGQAGAELAASLLAHDNT